MMSTDFPYGFRLLAEGQKGYRRFVEDTHRQIPHTVSPYYQL